MGRQGWNYPEYARERETEGSNTHVRGGLHKKRQIKGREKGGREK